MPFDHVHEETKVCNICNTEKPVDDCFVNKRRCKECQYAINKSYSKLYYQQHKARLIKLNSINYKIIKINSKPNGRPRIYDQQSEGISLLL